MGYEAKEEFDLFSLRLYLGILVYMYLALALVARN